MSSGALLLAPADWRRLAIVEDPGQELFNLAYHLRQPLTEVMAWPIRVRRDMWRRTREQYEFELKQTEKK